MQRPLSQCFHEVQMGTEQKPKEVPGLLQGELRCHELWVVLPQLEAVEVGCVLPQLCVCHHFLGCLTSEPSQVFFFSCFAVLFATAPPWCVLQPCHFPQSYSWKRISKITVLLLLNIQKSSAHTQVTNHAHQMANVALFTTK